MKRTIKVVAAIIENDQKEILCALRSPRMSTPNRWEFPGGKVEQNEDMYSALEREIEEELGCKIRTYELFSENYHEHEMAIIRLIAIKCSIIDGIPIPHEHSKLIWLKRENLLSLNWAPADIPAVQQLADEK
ncbi:(deoxy)nucleoside triphosphate pyrophosphohydrolase [Bacillus sp. Marseille-P3661]|uniref:(deoxy)nucleoside triphosphate pyrophosphohydrolase n=1 Tax=Bacillus sp. Marseille-P3661 TaxID=1936234 RepID=UPI000C8608D2|nr:(deoxy)nucleoside triphosphate pyrophosphohydrolase [Bacillus sp. Marseille-P3661]